MTVRNRRLLLYMYEWNEFSKISDWNDWALFPHLVRISMFQIFYIYQIAKDEAIEKEEMFGSLNPFHSLFVVSRLSKPISKKKKQNPQKEKQNEILIAREFSETLTLGSASISISFSHIIFVKAISADVREKRFLEQSKNLMIPHIHGSKISCVFVCCFGKSVYAEVDPNPIPDNITNWQ